MSLTSRSPRMSAASPWPPARRAMPSARFPTGANVQLNSLRKTSGAVNQSTLAISDVAKNTHLASERAAAAASLVTDGMARMSDMVSVVNAIAESSNRVRYIRRHFAHRKPDQYALSQCGDRGGARR